MHEFVCSENFCEQQLIKELVETCDYGCSNGECTGECNVNEECGTDECIYSENFCKENGVYRTSTCYENKCNSGQCGINSYTYDELVEECNYGCENSQCKYEQPECSKDTDCQDDYFSDNYCEDDNVYHDVYDFSCNQGSCEENIIKELVNTCDYKCSEGKCTNECLYDSDCDNGETCENGECRTSECTTGYEEFTFNNYNEVVSFINSLGYYPNSNAINYDPLSAKKVCELKGYSDVKTYTSGSFYPCYTKKHLIWDPIKNNFVQFIGCSWWSKYIDELTCKRECVQQEQKGVIIFQLDDVQAGWLEDKATRLVEIHINKEVPVTLAVIPLYLKDRNQIPNSITENLKSWNKNNKNVIEIAQHSYNHSISYSSLSLSQQIEDINMGKSIFSDLGIDVNAFVPPFDWGNQDTPAAISSAGFKVALNSQENAFIDSSKNPMILERGIMKNREFNEWSISSVESKIDNLIKDDGYAIVHYHQQDFENASDADFNTFAEFLQDLKDSGKYKFMTASQYYNYVNSD